MASHDNLSEIGRWALSYAMRGIKVFPLHYPRFGAGGKPVCSCSAGEKCDNIGKHPLTPHGFADASSDPETVKRWWWINPNANIGIATGAMSGFDVIDVDGEEGADSLHALEKEYGKLPDTVTVLTGGGGTHYWALHTPGITSKVGIFPHLDIRADGGYVVAPPSMHRSGNMYVYDAAGDWTDGVAPAALPNEWAAMLLDTCRKSAPSEPSNSVPISIPQGRRNRTMFEIASSLRSKGLSDAALLAAIRAENAERCVPPLEDRELITICGSVGRYAQGHSKKWDDEHPSRDTAIPAADSGEKKTKQTRFTGGGKLTELFQKDLPPIQWIWSERITTGLMLMAGAQKMGKSFLMLSLALCVADGKPFLGRATMQGEVCYLALEDSEHRIRRRCENILQRRDNIPEDFYYYTEAPSQGEGLEECIQNWCDEHPRARLIVVDTYGYVKRPMRTAGSSMTAYDADIKQFKPLKKLADKNNICLCLVTHLKKGAAGDDLMDRINGSNGQAATADVIYQLIGKRQAGNGGRNTDMALHIQGRDVSPDEIPLEFVNNNWQVRDTTGAAPVSDDISFLFYEWAQQVVANMPQRTWAGSAAMLTDALHVFCLTQNSKFRDAIPRSPSAFSRSVLTTDRIDLLESIGVYVRQEPQRRHGYASPWWNVIVDAPEEEEEEKTPFD